MFLLIGGGSCSGKSAYAESRVAAFDELPEMKSEQSDENEAESGKKAESGKMTESGNKTEIKHPRIYLATMQVYDHESEKRVERHRKMRAGKGFETVECPRDLPQCFPEVERYKNPVILLECLSNLVANEMFREDAMVSDDILVPKVVREVKMLRERAEHLVIVTNNIFEDGIFYEEWTERYVRALGHVNTALAKEADEVWEVVCGIPVRCGQ